MRVSRSVLLIQLRALLICAMGVASAVPPALAQSKPGDADLLKGLRAGGYVVVMRHASADPDKADLEPLNFRNVKAQQPLTELGRQSAKALGDTFRRLGISFGEVLTSRFNRAYQTALLAGFKGTKAVTELTEGSLVVSPNEQRRRAAFLRELTVGALTPGQNRLIVTHRVNIAQAYGKEWYDVKEGEASIFKIEKGAYSLLARLQLDEWGRLALVANKS
jgi:broad specificity phosphatase PhoE